MSSRSRPALLAVIASALVLAGATSACSGGGGGGGGDDDDGPITVTVTMLTEADAPVPGANVLVDGALYVTDSAGQIVVTNVLPPYAIGYRNPFGEAVRFWIGVTRADPVLRVYTGPFFNTSAEGALSPAADPALSGHVAFDALGSDTVSGGDSADVFETTVTWYEGTSIEGTLHAFRYGPGSEGLVSVSEYGSLDLTLDAGVPETGLEIPMAAITTGELVSTVNVPTGYLVARQKAWFAGEGDSPLFELGQIAAVETSFVTSDDPGLDVVLEVSVAATMDPAKSGIYRRRGAPTGTLTVDPPIGISVLEPVDGSVVSPGTLFSLEESEDASYYTLYAFTKSSVTLLVHSTSPMITLPDLAPLGTALVETGHAVRVAAIESPESIDDLLSGEPATIPGGEVRESRGSLNVTVDNP